MLRLLAIVGVSLVILFALSVNVETSTKKLVDKRMQQIESI